jgi:predicted nucleic acid-binding Zn ribbon protein
MPIDPQLIDWYKECPECGKEIPHYEDYCSTGCKEASYL